MVTVASICARGGSQGVPRKNIRLLGGKPLLAHTIEIALASPEIDRAVVSTDDVEIAEVAKAWGAEVPFLRPAELATSTAGKIPAIEHLVSQVEADGTKVTRVVDLDVTAPLRTLQDIAGTLALLDDDTDCAVTAYEADKNPYFNLVECDADGHASLSKKSSTGAFLGRQAAPPVYALNGSVYAWHRHTLAKGVLGGRTRVYLMPRERGIDVDSEIDFRLLELLLAQRDVG